AATVCYLRCTRRVSSGFFGYLGEALQRTARRNGTVADPLKSPHKIRAEILRLINDLFRRLRPDLDELTGVQGVCRENSPASLLQNVVGLLDVSRDKLQQSCAKSPQRSPYQVQNPSYDDPSRSHELQRSCEGLESGSPCLCRVLQGAKSENELIHGGEETPYRLKKHPEDRRQAIDDV